MDFLELLKRLHANDVEFVVVGGYASMLLGSDMLTQDLDICIRLGQENQGKLFDAIEDLGPRHRMQPSALALTRETATSCTIQNLYLETSLGILDCLGGITGLGEYKEVLPLSRPLDLGGFKVRSLWFDGLIRAKEALGREKDKQAVLKLKAIQENLAEQGGGR